MSGHLKQQSGNTIAHSFVDPKDVIIGKIEDEYIVLIDSGEVTERSFTFQHIHVDIFVNEDIVVGVNNPDQLEPFYSVKELVIEYPQDQNIGLIEIYCTE
jgi:hypothetical protein